MRVPMIGQRHTPTAAVKSFTKQQMLSVIRHVCQIQPTDGEVQLSLLARALVVSAKNLPGLTQKSFMREMQKIWDSTDARELRFTEMPAPSGIVPATEGDVAGLQVPGRS